MVVITSNSETDRDNQVVIEFPGLLSVSGSDVVATQSTSHIPSSHQLTQTNWELTLYCGRKGSEWVADSFVDACGGSDHVFCPSSGAERPDELNFYFKVEASYSVSGLSADLVFYLAQGHHGSANNWWIGGPNVSAGSPPLFTFAAQNDSGVSKTQRYEISGSTSIITVGV